jgi:hypothetical protein
MSATREDKLTESTARTTKSLTNQLPTAINTKTSTLPIKPTIKLCGCPHDGDLAALKSFNKAFTTYYTRPNRFLENMKCLDCHSAVVTMLTEASGKKAVVHYCDEGIKGFDAPSDDPMKTELICDLVLCPPCQTVRQNTFEKENEGRGARGRKMIWKQTLK